MIVLGLNAFHGDSAAALFVDGQLVAAVEEERYRRIKHWAGYPRMAVDACLEMASVRASDIDVFAVGRDPRANLARKAAFVLARRPSLGLVRDRSRNAGRIRELPDLIADHLKLDRARVRARMAWVEHHPAHLASAFFASPFDEAAVCAIDGFGDFVSTSTAIGRGTKLEMLDRTWFPHSLGLLYLAITQYLGFPKYGDEYKVMGLAPYGKPALVDEIRQLVKLKPNGRFELDLSYFQHHTGGAQMSWDAGEPAMGPAFTRKLEDLLGPARGAKEPVTPRHEDIARSLQAVYEESAFHVLNALHDRTGLKRLALAGGCGMNSVANGKIRASTSFTEVFIQPASGDNGTSIGAALYAQHQLAGQPRSFVMRHSLWGPEATDAQTLAALDARAADITAQGGRITHLPDLEERARWTAERIADGKIVGWYEGRMEFGARALGGRSIVADPRRADARELINTKIKFREKFRPFAPSILEESVNDYFVDAVADPFMIQVYPVRPEKRSVIPAVTHVDGSGRLQTVNERANRPYWLLIKCFEKISGVPVVLNTSFNENEPIVLTPDQALDCFLRTKMDVIVLGERAVEKG